MRATDKTLIKPTYLPPPTSQPKSFLLAAEQSDTVPVSIAEYQNLVACRVILDMLIDGIKLAEGLSVDSIVLFRAAVAVRELYL